MSDEPFMSRWSRRKREAETETTPAPASASLPEAKESVPPAHEARDAPSAKPPPSGEAELPSFDLESLPPIESITAETDIRPFLAPGVPLETARAALRRAWSVDPAIRDFVGLAEYAWDFTKPGSMPGFGPLEMTEEVRRYAARILGRSRSETETESETTPVEQCQEPDQAAARGQDSAPSESSTAAQAGSLAGASPVDSARHLAATQGSENVIAEATNAAPQRNEMNDSQHERETLPTIGRRRHGGALPE